MTDSNSPIGVNIDECKPFETRQLNLEGQQELNSFPRVTATGNGPMGLELTAGSLPFSSHGPYDCNVQFPQNSTNVSTHEDTFNVPEGTIGRHQLRQSGSIFQAQSLNSAQYFDPYQHHLGVNPESAFLYPHNYTNRLHYNLSQHQSFSSPQTLHPTSHETHPFEKLRQISYPDFQQFDFDCRYLPNNSYQNTNTVCDKKRKFRSEEETDLPNKERCIEGLTGNNSSEPAIPSNLHHLSNDKTDKFISDNSALDRSPDDAKLGTKISSEQSREGSLSSNAISTKNSEIGQQPNIIQERKPNEKECASKNHIDILNNKASLENVEKAPQISLYSECDLQNSEKLKNLVKSSDGSTEDKTSSSHISNDDFEGKPGD